MNTSTGPVSTLEVAMQQATRLLESQPALAVEQAQEILRVIPSHVPAFFLLASALQRVGRGDEAIAALRRTVELKPDHPEAWRVLADHLVAAGDAEGADAAYARHVRASTRDPQLQQAAVAMIRNDIPTAERLLKAHLHDAPTDVPAIRMLAEVAIRVGRNDDARKLLERCLELAPGFMAARYNYALLLHRSNDAAAALVQVLRLLEADSRNPSYRNLHAVILSYIGEYERSLDIFSQLLREYPAHSKAWLSYGHVLKTAGRQDEGIKAYRRSIACQPAFGEAYWSLANLKTFRFTEADHAAMRAQLARPELDDASRVNFHFALGKACEDGADYAQAFEHYSKGNALYRASHPYDADRNSARVKRLRERPDTRFLRQTRRMGLQGAGSHLHRRHAPRRLDPARADPFQPFSGRGNERAARDPARSRGLACGGRFRASRRLCARCWPARAPRNCGSSASSTSSAPAYSARPAGPFSSTRCPTTSCTSG